MITPDEAIEGGGTSADQARERAATRRRVAHVLGTVKWYPTREGADEPPRRSRDPNLRALEELEEAFGREARELRRVRIEVARVAGHPLRIDGAASFREDWYQDASEVGARLRRCGARTAIAWGALTGEGAVFAPAACGLPFCPDCARQRAAEQADRWIPVVEALRLAGYPLAHVTLTRPARDLGRPVILTRDERSKGYTGRAPGAGERGYAATGETLSEAMTAIRTEVDRLMGKGAFWRGGGAWKAGARGALIAYEATARSTSTRAGEDDGSHAHRPRWHVHAHVLVVFERGTRILPNTATGDPGWWTPVRAEWCAATGGSEAAQHLDIVRTASSVREVLKYPGKIGEMTAAQIVEWVAVTKGIRMRAPVGDLSPRSPLSIAAKRAVRDGTAHEDPFVAALADGFRARERTGMTEPVKLVSAEIETSGVRWWRDATEEEVRAGLPIRWVPLTWARLIARRQDDAPIVIGPSWLRSPHRTAPAFAEYEDDPTYPIGVTTCGELFARALHEHRRRRIEHGTNARADD